MMKRVGPFPTLTLALAATFVGAAAARADENAAARSEKPAACPGPVYGAKDVSRGAKVTLQPRPEGEPEGEGEWESKGRVVLRAVLCRTGEVTDIEVVEGLPGGLTEKAVAAARRINFTPAERRGRKVSQRVVLEYLFRVRD